MRIDLDPMVQFRQAAEQKITEHFNALAAAALHSDMMALVALARGRDVVHPAEERDALKAKLLSKVTTAETPAQIDAIVAGLS